MNFRGFIILIVSLTAVFNWSCERLIIQEDFENTPQGNFQLFWDAFDKHYSFFELENINWDSIYTVYSAKINNNTSDKNMFEYFTEIVDYLKDGHVTVYWKNQKHSFDYKKGYPTNRDFVELFNNGKDNYPFRYGQLKDNLNIGYIRIYEFSSGEVDLNNDSEYGLIDEILDELKETEGIVLDVRSNGGGNTENAYRIASRFAQVESVYQYERYRKGSNHNDFTDWVSYRIKPEGKIRYDKNNVVLINRSSYSATEPFILMMKSQPNSTIIGGNSGGGSGSPMKYELPNGMTFRLSTTQTVDKDFNFYEKIGIEPDIKITNKESDLQLGIDSILLKGIEILVTE